MMFQVRAASRYANTTRDTQRDDATGKGLPMSSVEDDSTCNRLSRPGSVGLRLTVVDRASYNVSIFLS